MIVRRRRAMLGQADVFYLKDKDAHEWLCAAMLDAETIEGFETRRRFKALVRKWRPMVRQIVDDAKVTLTMTTMAKSVNFVVGAIVMLYEASVFGADDSTINFKVELQKWTVNEKIFLSGKTLAALEKIWEGMTSELETLLDAETKQAQGAVGLQPVVQPVVLAQAEAPRGRGGRGAFNHHITCYHCQAQGHKAADCPHAVAARGNGARGGGGYRAGGRGGGRGWDRGGERGGRARGGRGAGGRGGGGRGETRTCHNCGEEGHIAFNCPYGEEY